MPRTLLIKLGAIGDVIMLLPAAHALHLKGHTIHWVCNRTVLPLLQLYPWIHPIPADEPALLKGSFTAKLRALLPLWRTLARLRYDQVFTLYYDPRYRLIALPVRAPVRITLSHKDRALQLLPGRHHTDEYARILLRRPDQANHAPLAPVPPPTLPPNPHPRPPGTLRLALAPGGARNIVRDDLLRRWPPEHYAQLARLLLKPNALPQPVELLLLGGPDDTWVRPHFASLAPSHPNTITDLIGTLTLTQTLALLESTDLFLTHDTGPLHLAGLTRTSLLTLFGPTDPRGRLPHRPNALALWGGEDLPCRPCYDGHTFAPCPSNDCLRTLTPEAVLPHLQRLLAARTASTPAFTPRPPTLVSLQASPA
jgi:heptosyltransferase-2